MIRLGFPSVSIYPNSGVMYENHGGSITFHGEFHAGNNSYISIGPKAIGDSVGASSSLKIVSYDKVTIGHHSRFGWETLLMDTDFHKLTKVKGGYSKGHAPIWIGDYNWFGNGCRILKRTKTPDYMIVGAGTITTGPIDAPSYSIVGTENKIVIRASGLWRNPDDDVIEY